MNYIKFRKEMRARRKELGITQGELAKEMGWKDGASEISRIENGKLALTKHMKLRISAALAVGKLRTPVFDSKEPVKLEKLAVQVDREQLERRVSVGGGENTLLIDDFTPTISSQEAPEVKEESYNDVVIAVLLMVAVAIFMYLLLSAL